MNRPRVSVAGLVGLVALSGVALAALLDASAPWAAAIPSIQAVTLVFAPLGVIYRTGARRAAWLGFALAGWAYVFAAYSPLLAPSLPTTRLLSWAYPRMIAEARQPGGREASMIRLTIKNAQMGASLGSLQWPYWGPVDVYLDRPDKTATKPSVEDVRIVGGTSSQNPLGVIEAVVLLKPEQVDRLVLGSSDVRHRFERHSSSPLSGLVATRVVQVDDFRRVGHALFGLLAALIGALAGCWFHATRPPESATPAGHEP